MNNAARARIQLRFCDKFVHCFLAICHRLNFFLIHLRALLKCLFLSRFVNEIYEYSFQRAFPASSFAVMSSN